MSLTPWGVHHLEIDEGLLVNGTLRVLKLEAVMPDGLVVSHGFREADTLEVKLTNSPEEMNQGEMMVHLVVPAKKALLVEGDLRRYDSVAGNPVADENTEGGQEVPIPRIRPRISLLVTQNDETPHQKYVSFPLVKVRYQDEKFTRTEFIPPYLRVPSKIYEDCSWIARRLREQANLLSERSRIPFSTKATLIRNLVAMLPYFEAIFQTKESHPYMLYLALCSLMGHLAAFGQSLLPPALPPYNHNDLLSAFERAMKFIHAMIDNVPISAFPFDFENGVFSLFFEEAWAKKGLVIAVSGRAGMSEEEVIDWIEGSLIGSQTQIQSMRERRILGIERQRTEAKPEFVLAGGEVFFSLENDSEFIESNEALQILNPLNLSDASCPAEIILYVPSN